MFDSDSMPDAYVRLVLSVYYSALLRAVGRGSLPSNSRNGIERTSIGEQDRIESSEFWNVWGAAGGRWLAMDTNRKSQMNEMNE